MNKWFDDLSKTPSALVLGGGGARGCYEIGAWQALRQANIGFDRVAGTSIGALVGAIYVQQTFQPLLHFAQTLKPVHIAHDMVSFPETLGRAIQERKEIASFLHTYIFSGTGMNISPLEEAFEEMFDYPLFEKSPIQFACMTFNVTEKRPQAFFKEQMNAQNAKSVILASASCYPAFPKMKMNGDEYIDGGYWDNVPVDLAVKMGARKVLAYNVEGPGLVLPVPAGIDVFEVKPLLPIGNFLDFSTENGRRCTRIGYLETMKLLDRLEGFIYSFSKEDAGQLAFLNGYLAFQFMIHQISVNDRTPERICRACVGYHDSNLSQVLSSKLPWTILIQTLGYVVGMDELAVYDVDTFCCQILERAQDIPVPNRENISLKTDQWMNHLGRPVIVSLFHELITQWNETGKMNLQRFYRLRPIEMSLAWTWYFLELVYGKKE